MKRTVTTILAALALLIPATAAQATDNICAGMDSGKIDTTGDPAGVDVTAPPNRVIVGYCVKAGSAKRGDGPEYVTLDQPVTSLRIVHSTGKAVSHYALDYAQITLPDPQIPAKPDPVILVADYFGEPTCEEREVMVGSVATSYDWVYVAATNSWVETEPAVSDRRRQVTLTAEGVAACDDAQTPPAQVPEPLVIPEPEPPVVAPEPDPILPDEPNEGRPNGAGGWEPEPEVLIADAVTVTPPTELAATGVREVIGWFALGAAVLIALGGALIGHRVRRDRRDEGRA